MRLEHPLSIKFSRDTKRRLLQRKRVEAHPSLSSLVRKIVAQSMARWQAPVPLGKDGAPGE